MSVQAATLQAIAMYLEVVTETCAIRTHQYSLAGHTRSMYGVSLKERKMESGHCRYMQVVSEAPGFCGVSFFAHF